MKIRTSRYRIVIAEYLLMADLYFYGVKDIYIDPCFVKESKIVEMLNIDKYVFNQYDLKIPFSNCPISFNPLFPFQKEFNGLRTIKGLYKIIPQ